MLPDTRICSSLQFLDVLHRLQDRIGTVEYCGKLGRENCDMECHNAGTHKSTYDAVILDKGERSRLVRSYDDVTREYVKTPLGQNRLIMF